MTNKHRGGYTIVELLIVLAISGVIALSAFAMINGQQRRNEFAQGVRDFETKLTDIANDIATGYFPNTGTGNNGACTATDTGISIAASGTVHQGGSNDCVFAGKAIQFRPLDGSESQGRLITLASRMRIRGSDQPVASLDDLVINDIDAVASLHDSVQLLYGFRVKSINGASAVGTIAFLTSFGTKDTSQLRLTGAPTVYPYTVAGTALASTFATTRNQLIQPTNYNPPPAAGIRICLEHGAGGATALVTLGAEGRQLTTTTEFYAAC